MGTHVMKYMQGTVEEVKVDRRMDASTVVSFLLIIFAMVIIYGKTLHEQSQLIARLFHCCPLPHRAPARSSPGCAAWWWPPSQPRCPAWRARLVYLCDMVQADLGSCVRCDGVTDSCDPHRHARHGDQNEEHSQRSDCVAQADFKALRVVTEMVIAGVTNLYQNEEWKWKYKETS